MYLVTIYNNNTPIIINDTTTSGLNRITGDVTQGINTIDAFTFSIYPTNAGYNQIEQWRTTITVWNEKTGLYEFRGRVLLIEKLMDSSGLIYKRVTCESELGYFHDSYTRYKKYENVSVTEFLQDVLDKHNKQVTEDKRFLLGNVEFNDNLQREVAYISTWECLKTRLFDNSNLGGELVVRYENGQRYLDYVKERGRQVNDTPIEVANNMISLTNEDDFSGFCTRLIPLGAKLQDSEERVTIKTVNNGLDYLEDVDGINKYGIIEKVVTWDDVHEPVNLLNRGQDYLANDNNIARKFSINAVDLSLLGLNPNSYQVCNYYPVINQLMGINEALRVVEKQFAIESPESATLMFGSLFDNIQDYQKKAIQSSLEAKELASITNVRIENTNATVNNINTTVNNQQIQINDQSTVIGNQGIDLANLQNNFTTLNGDVGDVTNRVTDIESKTVDLEKSLDDTKVDIIVVNDKLNRTAKRIMMEVF